MDFWIDFKRFEICLNYEFLPHPDGRISVIQFAIIANL